MRWWSRQSLTIKLPVALMLLLAGAFLALSAMMYRETRATVLSVASDRLAHAAGQLADILGTSGRQRLALIEQFGADADVRQAVHTSTPTAALRDKLQRYIGGAAATARVDLWDRDGRHVFGLGPDGDDPGDSVVNASVRQMLLGDAGPAIGPLEGENDRVSYAVRLVLTDDTGTVGLLVDRRSVVNQSQTLPLIATLIGEDATISVSNRDGSGWTELSHPLPLPGVSGVQTSSLFAHVRSDGTETLARAVAIPGTPWLSIVEFPAGLVLAPAHRLVSRAAWLTAGLSLIAALLGWVVARRTTAPLRQLTAAADLVAAAQPAPQLNLDRGDEIGALAECFNTMAANVADSRRQYEDLVRELEDRVSARTQELQSANSELEAFSYSVSHDLRAPLRAISGFVQILMEDARDQLDPEAQGHLDVVHRNARRMGALIDDLLAFSRLGRQHVSMSTVDLTGVASQIADEVRQDERDRALTITIDPLPPTHGDPTLLAQVFANLIQNAAKFTRRQAVAQIHVGITETEEGRAYFVRDNGAGFDMQYADKLFGVFHRLHRAEDFEGTGVGLAIVHRIISRHGGRIWAHAEVDRGATFYFTLPGKVESDT